MKSIYSPADIKKQRKPKPGHPWSKFAPGSLSKNKDVLPLWRDNK